MVIKRLAKAVIQPARSASKLPSARIPTATGGDEVSEPQFIKSSLPLRPIRGPQFRHAEAPTASASTDATTVTTGSQDSTEPSPNDATGTLRFLPVRRQRHIEAARPDGDGEPNQRLSVSVSSSNASPASQPVLPDRLEAQAKALTCEPAPPMTDYAKGMQAHVVADVGETPPVEMAEDAIPLLPSGAHARESNSNGTDLLLVVAGNSTSSAPEPARLTQQPEPDEAANPSLAAQMADWAEANLAPVRPPAQARFPWLDRQATAARHAERTAPPHRWVQHAPPTATYPETLPAALVGYYFVAAEGAMVHAIDRSAVDCRTFETAYASLLPHGKLHALLSHPSFSSHVCVDRRYAPGKPQTFIESGVRHFNAYQGVGWPAEPGDVGPFLTVTAELAGGDEEVQAIVVMTLGHLAQHPEERLRYIPSFVSPSSINAEVLREIATTVVGPKNVAMPDPTTFTSAHSDWLADTLLVMPTPVGASRSFQERMSSLLTSPQLLVNPKGRAHVRVANQVSQFAFVRDLGVFGHFPDPERLAPIPLAPGSLDPHEVDRFRRWFHGEGKRAVLHFLQNIDLAGAGFSAVKPPPRARMSAEFANLTRPPVENYLREALQCSSPPMDRDLVAINQITDHLLREVGMQVTWADVRDALVALQAVQLGQKRLGGRRPHLWAVRRADFWRTQSERAIAEHLACRR